MSRVIAVVALVSMACGGGKETWIGADPPKPGDEPEPASDSSDSRPRTKRDLVTRALKAIANNDPDAYIAMLPTSEEIETRCPSDYQLWENMLPNLRRDIRARIAECNQLIDFGRAVSVGGKDLERRDCGCDGEMYKHSDVKLLFRVGDKRYRVVIDDPSEFSNVFVVGDAPRCELDD